MGELAVFLLMIHYRYSFWHVPVSWTVADAAPATDPTDCQAAFLVRFQLTSAVVAVAEAADVANSPAAAAMVARYATASCAKAKEAWAFLLEKCDAG